jgi:hypothetical protein
MRAPSRFAPGGLPASALRQAQFIEQPVESGLAVRHAVAAKSRQRQSDTILQTLSRARKQKSLLMDWQQHVEMRAASKLSTKERNPAGSSRNPGTR